MSLPWIYTLCCVDYTHTHTHTGTTHTHTHTLTLYLHTHQIKGEKNQAGIQLTINFDILILKKKKKFF